MAPVRYGVNMDAFVKIAVLENEVEALCLKGELGRRGIPCLIRTHRDAAYDGIFQFTGGWGRVEAQEQHRDEVLEVLAIVRAGDEKDAAP